MKNTLLRLFLLFALAPAALFAQNEAPAEEGDDEMAEESMSEDEMSEDDMADMAEPVDSTLRAKWGIFGNVHAGMTYGTFGDLKTDLGDEDIFANEEYTINGLGTNLGGQIHLLFAKRVLISGGGSYYEYSSSLSEEPSADDSTTFNEERNGYNRGEAKVQGYTVGGNVGFAIMNKKQFLLWPYVGYSFGESELEVKNFSEDIMNIGDVQLDRAETQTYTSDIGILDFGMGFRYMKSKKGGLMFGAELGGYYNIAGNDWETEDGVVLEGLSESSMAGGYLRITVGGGFIGNNEADIYGEEMGEDAYEEDAGEDMMGDEEDEMSDREKRKAERRRKKAEKKARKQAEKEAKRKAKEAEQADEEVEETEETEDGGLE